MLKLIIFFVVSMSVIILRAYKVKRDIERSKNERVSTKKR